MTQYNKLKEATMLILGCGEDVGLMKTAVDVMYEVYLSFSSVNSSNQNDEGIILSSGKAISPSEAAQCLFDMKRTAKFIRGINEAIKQKLNENQATVQILYAGCGPYATLITPLLTLYTKREIFIDLLDINKISLLSTQKVINGLNLNNNIGKYLLEDASKLKIEKDYDIIISETMQAGLRNEPQVAIMQNLFGQMKRDAIFIPEEIIVEAKLNTRGNWNAEKFRIENLELKDIGEVLKVNRQTIKQVLRKTTFDLCKPTSECMELKLYTSIKIFKNEYLREGDSGLNSPLKLMELKDEKNHKIEFAYNQEYPVEIGILLN